jgi:hypothetical protein
MHLDLIHGVLRHLAHVPPVDDASPFRQLLVERNVFGNGQVGKERKVLINDLDAFADRVDRAQVCVLLAIDLHRPAVALVDAGNNLDQRRFAAAVLADETVNLAPFQRQADILQRTHTGKCFMNSGETDDFIGHEWIPGNATVLRKKHRGKVEVL